MAKWSISRHWLKRPTANTKGVEQLFSCEKQIGEITNALPESRKKSLSTQQSHKFRSTVTCDIVRQLQRQTSEHSLFTFHNSTPSLKTTSGGVEALRSGPTPLRPNRYSKVTTNPTSLRTSDFTICVCRKRVKRRPTWLGSTASRHSAITTTGSPEGDCWNAHLMKCSRQENPTFRFACAGRIRRGPAFGMESQDVC